MKNKNLLLILFVILTSCSPRNAATLTEPTYKSAVISVDSIFTDQLKFPIDDKGLDVTVQMDFDDRTNELAMTIKSSRLLFVFREDHCYKPLFHRYAFGRHRLNPEKLTYPTLIQPKTKYYLDGKVYKSYNPKRRRHLFNRWLGSVSKELTIIPPGMKADNFEATMLTDSVVQRFSVSPKATQCEITLRNVFVVEPLNGGIRARKSKTRKYNIVCDKDLNLTYKMNIQRDPCFGTESLCDSLAAMVASIKRDYRHLVKACPTGKTDTQEAVGIFEQHRQFLLSKYHDVKDSSACAKVQAFHVAFNNYRDSIQLAKCFYITPKVDKEGQLLTGINAQQLLETAHNLDNMVSRILVSKDAQEIHDLTVLCKKTISTINGEIAKYGTINENQRRALKIYRNSETYFRNMILKQ